MSKKILVNNKDYNGHKNVLFMMEHDDFRLSHDKLKKNYEIICDGKYSKGILATPQGKYEVFEDWSVELIENKDKN